MQHVCGLISRICLDKKCRRMQVRPRHPRSLRPRIQRGHYFAPLVSADEHVQASTRPCARRSVGRVAGRQREVTLQDVGGASRSCTLTTQTRAQTCAPSYARYFRAGPQPPAHPQQHVHHSQHGHATRAALKQSRALTHQRTVTLYNASTKHQQELFRCNQCSRGNELRATPRTLSSL